MKGTGQLGENYAANRLQRDGYLLLARNYRIRLGELDIVAQKDDVLAFVEVKTRGPNALGSPAEAVTPLKQRRIIRAASHYLLNHRCALQPRFDVFEVITDAAGRVVRHHHIEGAFALDETNRID